MDYKILNKEELDNWLFYHTVTLSHDCISIKENGINIIWKDIITEETIGIKYDTTL